SPESSIIAKDTIQIEAGFYIGPFTTGELRVDNSLIHTWSNPLGVVTYDLDTTTFSDGIHTLKIIGNTASDDYLDEIDINIINAEDWKILISEVRFDAVSEPDGEFFEIFNAFGFNVDIGRWIITDNEYDFIVPIDTIIASEDMLIFVRDESTFISEMSTLGITGITPDYTYSGIELANSGDELIIKDPDGNILDACIWGSGSLSGHTPWTGTIDDTQSLHRDPANVDTNDCSVDFIADTPDPGTVYISVIPSGFIPGFIITTTLVAIVTISLLSRFLIKKRK
ncbi:MAG: lamin tail domain-containing protein, partial [Asgard group archaeon]|nr:lamin tail domain-containing protein [Asgard group archaeon]